MRLFKQLLGVFAVLAVLVSVLMVFTYDVIKIDWPVFMEIQPSFKAMENPLPPPVRSIPVDGPVFITGMGAPENPMPADDASITRGAELFSIHCAQCHGPAADGNGPVAVFLIKYKPANLTSDVVQSKSDGSFFLAISNGIDGRMPALNENLTVSERWDVVNFLRTLKASE